MTVVSNLLFINLRTCRGSKLSRLLPPSSYSPQAQIAFYSIDKSSNNTSQKKPDAAKVTKFSPEKSYLDEILFQPKKDEPKTTAQKGKHFHGFCLCYIYLCWNFIYPTISYHFQ